MNNRTLTLVLIFLGLTWNTQELSAKEPGEVIFTITPNGWERYLDFDSNENDSYRYLKLIGEIKNVSKGTISFCYVDGVTTQIFQIDNNRVWFRRGWCINDKYVRSLIRLAPEETTTFNFFIDCRTVIQPETFHINFLWTLPLEENGKLVEGHFTQREPFKTIESNTLTVSSTTIIK